MAKYLQINDTSKAIEEATPITTSAGVGDANKIVQTNAAGRLEPSVMPVGFGDDVGAATTSEALAAGDMVNYHDVAGALRVRKADATALGKAADGYVLAAFASGAVATVYHEGTLTGLSGLTNGASYFLSATPGGITLTPPTTAGQIFQRVGKARGTTELVFEPGDPIVRG